jgi:hypothetical protein
MARSRENFTFILTEQIILRRKRLDSDECWVCNNFGNKRNLFEENKEEEEETQDIQ